MYAIPYVLSIFSASFKSDKYTTLCKQRRSEHELELILTPFSVKQREKISTTTGILFCLVSR